MITIIDKMDPQDVAMLQALYSRSPAPVARHLDKVRRVGSGRFMERYYVGYGHSSIGDCGTTTIFIEGVSMLQAKAIQQWPLYSGQECSTRYMDFAEAGCHDPVGTDESAAIIKRWLDFYAEAMPEVVEWVMEQHPRRSGESEKVYTRAINARAFDIMRGFLPAGMKTSLSWHTNLRQARDHLNQLECHPDPDVADLAHELHDQLQSRYPHAFNTELDRARRDSDYLCGAMCDAYQLDAQGIGSVYDVKVRPPHGVSNISVIRHAGLSTLNRRPKHTPLPRHLDELGMMQSKFLLDFGSWRDLARHRAGLVRMPLLTTGFWMHPWYLNEMPGGLRSEAIDMIKMQVEAINALDCDSLPRQNYIPMGFVVPCRVTQTIPAFIYRVELRSSQTVHPTLRAVTLKEIWQFKEMFPSITLHVDERPDQWSTRRGEQTIEEKQR